MSRLRRGASLGDGMPPLRSVTAGATRARRRALAAPALTLALWLIAGQGGGDPARAAARGTIKGKVINGATGRPQGGVRVTLTGGRADGSARESHTSTTTASGGFEFAGLATGPGRFYALDARYDGGLFAGGAVPLPGDTSRPPVVSTRIKVWKTTTEPTAIVIERDDLFAVRGDNGLTVVESVDVANTSSRAYIGRGAGVAGGSGGPVPTLAFPLPAGAAGAEVRILDATVDVPRIVRTGDLGGFATTIAIPPGKTKLTFTYPVAGSTGRYDLSRTALYPVLEYSIFASDPFSIESDALIRKGDLALKGATYRRWTARGTLEAGDPIQADAVAVTGGDPVLIGGLVALGTIAAAGAALGIARRRRHHRARPAPLPASGAREALIEGIARLDLRHDAGEIDTAEWSRVRAELKARLAALQEPEPAS